MVDDNGDVVQLGGGRAPLGPGRHHIAGTDLDLVLSRRGDVLVLHLNKAGVLVYRTLLIDACKEMPADHLLAFRPFAHDMVLKIGDLADGLRRASAALREADG
jgi:hypothetical protein